MLHSLLLQSLRKHVDLSDDDAAVLATAFEEQALPRRKHYLREGEICRHHIFVTNGVLRSYTVDANGFEHVLSFAPPGWWAGDLYSLLSGKPGTQYIQALEDTQLLLLPQNALEGLYTQLPALERYFRIIIQNSLVTHQQRIADNLGLPAEARYEAFCKRYPALIDCLQQKQVAAYIGVTPEFFSKMRSRMLRGK